MKRPSIFQGIFLGALTSLPVMGLLYLANQFAGLPFVPYDLFDWLARVLPGDVITLGIDAIVRTINTLNLGSTSDAAKAIEQLMALIQFVGILAVSGGLLAVLMGRLNNPANQLGMALGALLVIFIAFAESQLGTVDNLLLGIIWVGVLLIAWGSFMGSTLKKLAQDPDEPVDEELLAARRAMLLKLVGGSAGLAVGTWGIGRFLANQATDSGAGVPLTNLGSQPTIEANPAANPTANPAADPAASPTAEATLRDRISPAPGTRPELTSNEDFYRIDINTRAPVIDKESWVLKVDGLFDNPRDLTLDELMSFPTITQTVTMGCISNRIGGDLIGTSNWTGVRLRDVLADLGIRPEAKELYIEATDGFFESVDMNDIMDPRTLLVFGMNGETLPVEHGFPLRIYIPNRYGMKQPKWITRIEAIDEQGPGYWVTRGWSEEARPQIVSVIDTINVDEVDADGRVPVGGIAWAGDRGIQKIEVQVDGGEWVEASLRTPPLSPLTWVQWRYDWPAEEGAHSLHVRATDGTGTLQTAEEQGVRPDGATGYHQKNVNVRF